MFPTKRPWPRVPKSLVFRQSAEGRIVVPMVDITHSPIEVAALARLVGSNDAGATVIFLGTTREHTAGRRTASLDYECHESMAREQLAHLETEARKRWPL